MGTGVGLGDAVFPAGAGMNRLERRAGNDVERVPRGSGDEPAEDAAELLAEVCSPRERG